MYVCMYVCMRPPYPVDAANPAQTQPTKLPGTVFGRFRGNLPGSPASLPRSRQPSCLAPFSGVSGELAGQPGQPCPVLQPPCPVLSPPLPSYVCMQSPLPSYTRSHPCPVMYVCMYVCSHAAQLCGHPAQLCSHPCPVMRPSLPSYIHGGAQRGPCRYACKDQTQLTTSHVIFELHSPMI